MGEVSSKTRDVFLSYSSKDKAVAEWACAVLERHRTRCWMAPRDMTPGDVWATGITKGIDASRIMVLIFSDNANVSKFVRKEVQLAIDNDLTVLAFRIQDVKPSDAMKFNLIDIHWLDAFEPSPLVEAQLELLAASVRTLLGRPPRPPGPVPEPPAAPGRGRSRAFWPIAIGSSLLGVIALGIIVIGIPTRNGGSKMAASDDSPGSLGRNESAVDDRMIAKLPLPVVFPVHKPQRPPASSAVDSSFVPLLNGKDLSGWRVVGNQKHSWRVLPGGVLEGSGPPTASTLTTDFAGYGNFHLRVETKMAEGPPSAIAFRITGSNGESAKYIAQLAGSEQGEANTGSLRIAMPGPPVTLAMANPVVEVEPDEWFTEEVIAQDDVITVVVKGVEVAKFKLLRHKLRSGAIGLICRGNSKASFRKIEVKRLNAEVKSNSIANARETSEDAGTNDLERLVRIFGNGDWRVEGEELVQTKNAKLAAVEFGDNTWTDYSFSADVKVSENGSGVGLVIRAVDEKNYWYGADTTRTSFYRWVTTGSPQFSILRRGRSASLVPGRWHKMRIEASGLKFAAYLDGKQAFTLSDSSISRGKVGFRSETPFRVRNVKVTSSDGKILWDGLPELPTASSFGVPLPTQVAPSFRGD